YLTLGDYDMRAKENWFCSLWTPSMGGCWLAEGLEERIPRTSIKLFDLPWDDEMGWAFGDGGRYHVYAAPEDARVGRFESGICYEVNPAAGRRGGRFSRFVSATCRAGNPGRSK